MTSAGLPNPEELLGMLQDTAEARTRITLTVSETVLVLVTMATFNAGLPGCESPDCETCNAFNTVFWELSNALPLGVRYQKALRIMGTELPPAPWEVVSQG
jgi:hypothetical protein